MRRAEAPIGRNLDDPELLVRKGTKLLGEVRERRLHAPDGSTKVGAVARMMEDPEGDVVPLVLQDCISAGEDGCPEAGRFVGHIMEVAPAVLHPGLLENPGRDRDL